jgi:hypothetical protein
MNGAKIIPLALIILVVGAIAWRVGDPDSFNAVLSEAGLSSSTPVTAPVSPPAAEPAPAPEQPAHNPPY